MTEISYKSKKTETLFTVSGDKDRAYLLVTGVASTNSKVQKEMLRIRREGSDFATVDWIARQFAQTF